MTAAAQPRSTPASATDSLAAVAAAALANAERFAVSGRTIRRDIQALQERGIERRAADRWRRSQRTRAQYAAIYRRFVAWLADELDRPPTRQDLSGDVLARWIAQRASVGGHGGGGLSSASLRLECSALRQLARHAGRPELAASLHASRQEAPPPETISPEQYEQLLGVPDPETPAGVRDRAIVRLLGDVGLRPSEVCALQLGDILSSVDGRTPDQLRVAWGEGRVVRLTQQATVALVDWLARHPGRQPEGRRWELSAERPLFVALGQPKTAGQAMTEGRLLRQVLRHAQQAEIPAHLRYPYVLRHYWATQQVARGITPAELQARGGWRDRRSAQAYFQRPPASAALAAALDLDRATPLADAGGRRRFLGSRPREGDDAIRSGPVTVGRTRNWYPRQNRIASACLSQTPLFGRISLGVDHPREACGLWAPGEPVANLRYDGLHALRHRGRESAGMAVVDGYGMPVYNMPVYKKMGLVRQVLDKATLATHEGHLGVGQTLHSTTGGSRWEDAQPAFRTNAAGAGIAAARNGNLATTALAGHLISKVLTAADGLRSAVTQPLTLPLSNP